MNDFFIFDLDGTLSLADHREHLLKDRALPEDERWKRFFEASANDAPNIPVLKVLTSLHRRGHGIRLWSGRSDAVRDITISWLNKYTPLNPIQIASCLRMRPADSRTPDHELKLSWLNSLTPSERTALVGVFDDRQSVVDMWRANGVTCFQVAPGNF